MENNKQQPLVVGIICVVLAVSVLVYKSRSTTITLAPDDERQEEQHVPIIIAEEEVKIVKPVKPKYPHCVRNDSGELQELVIDLVEDLTTCDPTEMSFSPSCPDDDAEGRGGMVVVYTAVSLLLVSLAAAAVEVWRLRGRQPPGNAAESSRRDPPQLSRRCSLADLTVLRHNRRESMLRRDSAMHMSVDSGTAVVNAGAAHQHRVPLKLLGSSKSQDDGGRRGSLAMSKACKWQRSVSADKADENVPDVHHHRIHMIRHH